MSELGPFHCPNCKQGYDDYHRCPEGSDRVAFACNDCEQHKNRETHQLDIEGVTPQRCTSCTFDKMAEP